MVGLLKTGLTDSYRPPVYIPHPPVYSIFYLSKKAPPLYHHSGRKSRFGFKSISIDLIKTKIMKTLFAALLVAFTVSTASVGFAAPAKSTDQGHAAPAAPAAATVTQVLMSKLDVVVGKEANPKTIIRLLDASGNNLATKKISNKETANRVRFDLAALADGVYYVKVWDGQHTQLQKFELKTAAVSLTAYQKLALIQKPALVQNLAIL
jgi:hypothetical protein